MIVFYLRTDRADSGGICRATGPNINIMGNLYTVVIVLIVRTLFSLMRWEAEESARIKVLEDLSCS